MWDLFAKTVSTLLALVPAKNLWHPSIGLPNETDV